MNVHMTFKQSTWAVLVAVVLVGCGAPAANPTAFVPTATLVATEPAAPTAGSSASLRKLTVEGVERSYLLHIPPGLDINQPVPVIFAFHGMDDNALTMGNMAGFDDVADRASFLVVYPEGVQFNLFKGWNLSTGGTGEVNELAFIRQILSDLDTMATIDAKRVYAAGFSMGGDHAYQLACDTEVFAAVASVSARMEYGACQPSQAVSVLHVHGLIDPFVPSLAVVEQGIANWVRLNECTSPGQVEELCHTFVGQSKRLGECADSAQVDVTHTVYQSCQAGTAVELYTIASGRHTWPTNYEPPFSQVIWDFFAEHPKPLQEEAAG